MPHGMRQIIFQRHISTATGDNIKWVLKLITAVNYVKS